MNTNTLKVGDKVVYSRRFLHNIGDYTAESANQIGIITEIKSPFVRVQWETEPATLVHDSNLWPANKIHLEPA